METKGKLYLEIIVALLFILISIPIWRNFEKLNYAETARYYDNLIKKDS